MDTVPRTNLDFLAAPDPHRDGTHSPRAKRSARVAVKAAAKRERTFAKYNPELAARVAAKRGTVTG